MRPTAYAITFLLLLATITLTISIQPAKAETVYAFSTLVTCDSAGNVKNTFLTVENVYVKGGFLLPHNKEIAIYVIPKDLSIKTDNAISGPIYATTNSHGHLPITQIWSAPLTIGEYNVWIDVNKNGKYDIIFDRPILPIRCWNLFHVIPETWIGSIGAITAMLGSFALFQLTRTTRLFNSIRAKKPTTSEEKSLN
jgi:hypothetical protein